jgi:hypothetical protein
VSDFKKLAIGAMVFAIVLVAGLRLTAPARNVLEEAYAELFQPQAQGKAQILVFGDPKT